MRNSLCLDIKSYPEYIKWKKDIKLYRLLSFVYRGQIKNVYWCLLMYALYRNSKRIRKTITIFTCMGVRHLRAFADRWDEKEPFHWIAFYLFFLNSMRKYYLFDNFFKKRISRQKNFIISSFCCPLPLKVFHLSNIQQPTNQ